VSDRVRHRVRGVALGMLVAGMPVTLAAQTPDVLATLWGHYINACSVPFDPSARVAGLDRTEARVTDDRTSTYLTFSDGNDIEAYVHRYSVGDEQALSCGASLWMTNGLDADQVARSVRASIEQVTGRAIQGGAMRPSPAFASLGSDAASDTWHSFLLFDAVPELLGITVIDVVGSVVGSSVQISFYASLEAAPQVDRGEKSVPGIANGKRAPVAIQRDPAAAQEIVWVAIG
jgi:hypothetical protein